MSGDFQVNTAAVVDVELRPDVGMNAAGDFVVVWDDTVGFFDTAMGRRFDSAGAPLGDPFPISATTLAALGTKVASDSSGNFVVTWGSAPVLLRRRGGRNDNSRRRGRGCTTSAALPVSTEFVVNETTTGSAASGTPPSPYNGSFVVAWNSGIGVHIRHQGPQERSPRSAGDHGRPAPRSGLRTHGRQQPQQGIRTRRNGHRSLRVGQRHCRRRRRGGRSDRTVTALHRTSGCGLHARGMMPLLTKRFRPARPGAARSWETVTRSRCPIPP